MPPVDPHVLEGRNPWWAEAWESLTGAQRREVRSAIWSGRRIQDPELLPFVYGRLAQARRSLRWWLVLALPFYTAWMGLWLYLACFDGSGSSCLLWSVVFGVWVAAVPIALIVRLRQLRRSERANMWGMAPNGGALLPVSGRVGRPVERPAEGPAHQGAVAAPAAGDERSPNQ